MRTKNIALIALTIMLSIHIQRIEACTRAVYIGPDNLIVTGRTMDWKEDIMSNLYVFPRGIQRAGYNKGETGNTAVSSLQDMTSAHVTE